MDEESCLKCGQVLEDVVEECPGCHVRVVYCSNPMCGQPLLEEVRFCPFCKARNEDYVETVEEIPPNIEKPVSQTHANPPDMPADAATLVDSLPKPADFEQHLAPGPKPDVSMPDLPPEISNTLEKAGLPELSEKSPSFPASGVGPAMDLAACSDLFAEEASGIPVVIEMDDSLAFKKGQMGAIKLRMKNGGIKTMQRYRLLLSAPHELGMNRHDTIDFVGLRMNEVRHLPLRECRPSTAGFVPLSIKVLMMHEDGTVLCIWEGSKIVKVQDKETKSIHIGGDVIDLGMGDRSISQALGMSGDLSPNAQWQPFTLDEVFSYKGQGNQDHGGRTLDPSMVSLTHEQVEGGVATIIDQSGHQKIEALVQFGGQVSFGRLDVGQPKVGTHLFRVQADNAQSVDTRRISGTHLELQFMIDRICCRDVSTNGTWLNNHRMEKNLWYPLTDGDSVSLRQVAKFKIAIQSDRQGPYAITFAQSKQNGQYEIYGLAKRFYIYHPTEIKRDYASPYSLVCTQGPSGTKVLVSDLNSNDKAQVEVFPNRDAQKCSGFFVGYHN